MHTDFRHRVLQRVLWSPIGLPFVRFSTWLAQRWTTVVMNRSARSSTNGEFWLATLLPDSPAIVDVGFHAGEFAEAVLKARPAARVFGFEPAASIRTAYERRCPVADVRVTLEPIAISDREGEFIFHDDASAQNSLAPIPLTDRTVTYPVRTTTMDAYAILHGITHIDLLKIDVEGHDLHVLEGSRDLLAEQRIDLFVFEYNFAWVLTRRYLRDAVLFVAGNPYRLFRLFNGFLSPLAFSYKEERFDHTTMFVGVSDRRLARGDIPIRPFPES
jgi:FkbM family methyltransferase